MGPIEQPSLGDRILAFQKEVRGWSRITAKKLMFRVAALNLQERVLLANQERLRTSIKSNVKTRFLEVERVSFSFPIQGIFIEHGVGKGRLARSANAQQHVKQWIKPGMDEAVAELADLLANEYADIAAETLAIRIPGQITTKIKVNG
jgi:hypothetical protein